MAITKDQAMKMIYRTCLYHVTMRNGIGSAVVCRVNGKCHTWKTRPDDFRLPVKHGLRDCFYITPANAGDWSTVDPELGKRIITSSGFREDTPWQIVYDALVERGAKWYAGELATWAMEYDREAALAAGV